MLWDAPGTLIRRPRSPAKLGQWCSHPLHSCRGLLPLSGPRTARRLGLTAMVFVDSNVQSGHEGAPGAPTLWGLRVKTLNLLLQHLEVVP